MKTPLQEAKATERFKYFDDVDDGAMVIMRKLNSLVMAQADPDPECEVIVGLDEWLTFLDFLKENIMTEERVQREYDSGRATGVSEENRRLVAFVKAKAAEYFMNNEDIKANQLRCLAIELQTPGK